MCGICGYVGSGKIKDILIDGLYKLEYRGYDSSGIALLKNKRIKIIKSVGEVNKLEKLCVDVNDNYVCGIAHTRWATHGKATLENCHPHESNNGDWVVVHNGIIENFTTLKNELLAKKYKFMSQTDTEVITNMLQEYESTTPIRTLTAVCRRLVGSFALAVVNRKQNNIYLAKRLCPLYVCKTNNGMMVSSDMSVFFNKAKECYTLDDDEFAVVNQSSVVFYNLQGKKLEKKTINIENEKNVYEECKEKHFMLKEIKEIPSVLNLTYRRIDNLLDFELLRKKLKNIKRVTLIGCGTANHACMIGGVYLERIANLDTRTYVASEYRYGNHIVDKNTLYIFVSQSGETADTIACAKHIKESGGLTLAISNVKHSTINNIVDFVIPTTANKEIAVASTKAYNCQCLALMMLANIISKNSVDYENKIAQIKVPTIDFSLQSKKLEKAKKVFFIGRDIDYISCLEASLKLKEITYINCMAIPAGELKHGTIALVDDSTIVIVICTQEKIADKVNNAINEIHSRFGHVWLFSTLDKSFFSSGVEYYCKVDSIDNDFDVISSIVPMQLLAYSTSCAMGINPDKPRNLAKSVTVE